MNKEVLVSGLVTNINILPMMLYLMRNDTKRGRCDSRALSMRPWAGVFNAHCIDPLESVLLSLGANMLRRS